MQFDQKRADVVVQRLGMGIDVLLSRLQAIKEKAFYERQGLMSINSHWDKRKEYRLSALGKFINIFDITQFSIDLLGKILMEDWYRENLANEGQQEPDFKMVLTVEWERTTKYRFGMSLFTLIESSFRVFLRSLDPVACKGSTSNFDSIYKCLLGSNQLNFANANYENAKELLNFVRIIRNLIHNDGVLFEEDGHDITVTYRKTQYHLYNGKPVEFVTWDLLLAISEDILRLLTQVISHPKIFSQNKIINPIWQVQ